MRGAAPRFDLADEILERRHRGERAVGDRFVDARQILHHHPAGAEIHVPDLGIAHLPVGQADIMLACLELRVRPALHQRVPDRCPGAVDRIVGGLAVLGRALTPAVEDAQHNGARAGNHGWRCLEGRALVDIYANPAGLGIAPAFVHPSASGRMTR